METLPVELRRAVVEELDLLSLKSLRLTAKSWAFLGEERLISSHFNTLPHRPDITRLVCISQSATFGHTIKELHMNHGEVNEYHARHNTYFLQYTVDPESRLDQLTSTWGVYAELKEKKDRYLPASCTPEALTTAFAGLPNLNTISVTLMTCPFQEEGHPELLKDIWQIPSTRLFPRVATTERFTSILTSTIPNLSRLRIETLSHDRLPLEFFAQKPSLISRLSCVFETLLNLTLALDYSDMPNNIHYNQAFRNLSLCLRSAAALKKLDLEVQGRRKIDIGPLLSSFEDDGFAFQHLELLALKGMVSSENTLGAFLTRQRSLKRLQLGGIGVRQRYQSPTGGIHLSEGTFKGLFECVSGSLNLESFKVQGDLVELVSGERWVLEVLEDHDKLSDYVTG